MHVGITMLTLVPKVSGGSETYARELTRSLNQVGEHGYEVLAPRTAPDAGDGLPTIVASGVPASATTYGRLRSMTRLALRPGELRARLEAADVVHYPLTVPLPPVDRPTVVTLHDLQHLDLPELFDRPTLAFRRWAYDRAARKADQVVVISEWTRGRAIELLALDPRRVHAIRLGIDHEWFTPDPSVSREPFILYPARPWPHKNHERLFAALALLRRERPALRLVLTGEGHDGTRAPEGVDVRGAVPRGELVDLYRRASALVFPSLYEGFGLPPLEAMACGCPVASSWSGSLTEVCGDAAVLFDPTDPEDIARGVLEAIDGEATLRVRGLAQAAKFSWEQTARRHDAVYEAAAA